MRLAFRNVDVPPGTPVSEWPFEAIAATIERGTITDWATLSREIRRDPWGPIARQIEEYLAYERPRGLTALLEQVIAGARSDAQASERAAVAREVDDLVRRTGLTLAAFAQRIGTSTSRMSTYRSGRVTPSAALLQRMRGLAERLQPDDYDSAGSG